MGPIRRCVGARAGSLLPLMAAFRLIVSPHPVLLLAMCRCQGLGGGAGISEGPCECLGWGAQGTTPQGEASK